MAIESISLWHAIYNRRPFQEHTKNKLELFYDHVRAWLSVFARSHTQVKECRKRSGSTISFAGRAETRLARAAARF